MFVVGWLLKKPKLRLLEMSLRLAGLSKPLFGWHFMCVLSSTQTVGTNVGVRFPEVIKLQLERK
jgi:hypothetical protein